MIREGKIDIVSLGRQMLCDPDYANKVRAGEQFLRCDGCWSCLMRTAAGLTVRCCKNPNLGRRRFMPECWPPAFGDVGVKVEVTPSAPAIPCPGLDGPQPSEPRHKGTAMPRA